MSVKQTQQTRRGFRRIHKSNDPPKPGPDVDQQVLSIISGKVTEPVVRTRFLQMAQQALGATAACFLVRSSAETWLPAQESPKFGRLPEADVFSADFSSQCDGFARSPNIQHLPFGKLSILLAPVHTSSNTVEIMMVVLQNANELADATRVLQKMSTAFQLWMRSRLVQDHEWQIASLGTIIELLGRLEKKPNVEDAAEELANLLANHFQCSSAAVGVTRKGRVRLQAISGIAKIDRGSDVAKSYLATMTESTLRQQAAVFPPADANNNHLLQAHRQLAAVVQSEAVYSLPLISDDDEQVGAVILTGKADHIATPKLDRFCLAAGPAIARTLQTVDRVRLSRTRRAVRFTKEKLSSLKSLAVLAIVILAIAALFLPVTYRVRCNCVTEVVTRRFAVAPFDGLIVTGSVQAGDIVEQGQVLCEMDGRTIRWELSGVTAERQQSARTREIELTERNIPKAFLAELEHDRLTSQEAILQYKRDHLLIKSPIDGVVLAGDVERAEAASVETGQVLFEVGPIKPLRIQIAIPSEEIAQVKAGHPVSVWIEGQEENEIEGQIERISPRSETRDGLNVFVAEVEFANEEERLRPGMSGTVRIDCEERQLGWTLFHKPMNYMRSRFAWW